MKVLGEKARVKKDKSGSQAVIFRGKCRKNFLHYLFNSVFNSDLTGQNRKAKRIFAFRRTILDNKQQTKGIFFVLFDNKADQKFAILYIDTHSLVMI